MTLFVVLAALMLIAALAVVLRPLLKGRAGVDPAAGAQRRMKALQEAFDAGVLSKKEFAAKRAELAKQPAAEPSGVAVRSRSAFMAAIAIALLLPAAAIVLYRLVGEPRALDPAVLTAAAPAAAAHGADMDDAINKLAAKLKQNPDDVQGWALLGRAYLETEHFDEARDALKHAHDLLPDDADISIAYSEALTLASESHRIEGEAKALLDKAMKADPNNQRGLWLLGIGAYQAHDYPNAIANWNRLLALLPADSTVLPSLKTQIARAEAERDGRPLPEEAETPAAASAASPTAQATAAPSSAAPPATGESPNAGDGPRVSVTVALDPKIASKAAPDDTVFVYAKAASGPPMPLAIQRLQVKQLPATVVLTDGMGMMPSMKLSQFPQVVIGARVSKSGNAIAQSGDLQTLSKPLDPKTSPPLSLTIDQTVP